MSFFHGITITEVQSNGVNVQIINSAVIGLVGSAPQWSAPAGAGPGISKPTLVLTASQASNFGQEIAGYTIPSALGDIQEQGAGAVIVIDVFNPLIHQSTFISVPITAPTGTVVPVSLGYMGLIGPGLPNTPLATVSLDAVVAPGGATGASYAAADTITLAGGVSSVAAILTVATTQLVQLASNAAGGGSDTTSYEPGDEITLAGGTHSIAPVLEVTSTKVVAAAVAAGGSGGTNGTQTVTGTTGNGTKFQASVTVSGGAITAVLSISVAGNYALNPTDLTIEPVTGADLVGAELALTMGVNTFNIIVPGSFTVNSATFTQASTTGVGTGATFNGGVFGVLTATVSTAGSYSTVPTNPVGQASTTGSGTGATFNITFAGPPSTVLVKNSNSSTTYVEGTDYKIDYVNGLLYLLGGSAITNAQSLKVTAAYCDPSKVSASDIVGAVSGNTYTGLQALLTTFNRLGFTAQILIAPSFYDLVTATALLSMANQLKAYTFVDAPPQTSVATAVANRGAGGSPFNLASDRLGLCFPWQNKVATAISPTGVVISAQGIVGYTKVTGNVDTPYSQWVAGALSASDVDPARGFWYSPSNYQIEGILGPDISMYMSAFDPAADTNTLNAAGIITVFNGFATGFRVWGNRSSSFPASTSVTTFTCIRRTLDVVERSIQVASLPCLDQPITNGLINSILTSVNRFINSLIQKGALLSGSSINYVPADNPPDQLALGKLTFEVNVMPPPPAENIIYNFAVDLALLANLGPATSSSQTVVPTA